MSRAWAWVRKADLLLPLGSLDGSPWVLLGAVGRFARCTGYRWVSKEHGAQVPIWGPGSVFGGKFLSQAFGYSAVTLHCHVTVGLGIGSNGALFAVHKQDKGQGVTLLHCVSP